MGQVLHSLQEYCAALAPGDLVPTHTELMRRFDASERAVRWALDELRREGKIVRRQGAGTFVAERQLEATEPVIPVMMADSKTIVAIGKPDRAFFDQCMHLLLEQAEADDLSVVCRLLNPENDSLPAWAPDGRQTKGFLLFSYNLSPLAKQLQDAGSRVVIVGAPPAEVTPEVPCVYGDHELGGYLATKHLLDLGHRRLAFVGNEGEQRTLRWRGHQRAVREAQRKAEVQAILLPAENIAVWAKEPALAAAYFARPGAPTGMVTWNDHEGASLLAVLSRAGVKVPDQVSLVGYDNLPEGQMVYPALTTVDHAIGQQLQTALSLLTRPVPPPPSHSVVVLPTLVRRESCAPPDAA